MFYTVSFVSFSILTTEISMYFLVILASEISSLLVLVLAQLLMVNLGIYIIHILIRII